MDTPDNTNPILPAPGVCRNQAISTDASRTGSGRQNDDGSTNRTLRGETSENSRRAKALINCRDLMQIGTLNVETLRDECKAAELEQRSIKVGIDILGIQEHRIIHDDPVEFRKIGTSYLVTSSGWRNDRQASQGGVGLLLSRKAKKALLDVKCISNRILVAEFDGNPKTTVVVIYSPHNSSDPSEVEQFYKDLRNTLQDVPAHNFLAVVGDFNARLGPDAAPFTLHDETNRNGFLLLDLLVEFGLIANNTQFQKWK